MGASHAARHRRDRFAKAAVILWILLAFVLHVRRQRLASWRSRIAVGVAVVAFHLSAEIFRQGCPPGREKCCTMPIPFPLLSASLSLIAWRFVAS